MNTMTITYAPEGRLQIDNARIVYRNFTGRPSKYNREGDRNFAVIIPNEVDILGAAARRVTGAEAAAELADMGWNVRERPPREEGEEQFRTLAVKVKYGDYRPPVIYLKANGVTTKLNEEEVNMLDDAEIINVDLDISPYDWKRDDGRSGRAAYLHSMCVTVAVDRFAAETTGSDAPF